MQSRRIRTKNTTDQRKILTSLVREIKARPLEFLPERSVAAVASFFDGYMVFCGPLEELTSFGNWVLSQLIYPNDTGVTWSRCIQLNSMDSYDSFHLFLKLYFEFIDEVPSVPIASSNEAWKASEEFDFFRLLYSIGRRPGMWFPRGNESPVHLLFAYISGYFTGKNASGFRINRDERKYLRFELWLQRYHKLNKPCPLYRILELWPFGRTPSVESFFDAFDAYLTDFGKNPCGLDDVFEVVKGSLGVGFTVRRRKKLPKKLTLLTNSSRWWRQSQEISC